uniref:Uncharacterized protein n=1 Tax=Trypanosoma congolense (strain IL3000) TaxID=1068625 RepID=G0USQ1_TRYCI|nr:hypothetical protein, unlikely [Trypanosoma congolense IL3000]
MLRGPQWFAGSPSVRLGGGCLPCTANKYSVNSGPWGAVWFTISARGQWTGPLKEPGEHPGSSQRYGIPGVVAIFLGHLVPVLPHNPPGKKNLQPGKRVGGGKAAARERHRGALPVLL